MLVKRIIKKICESLFGEIERQDAAFRLANQSIAHKTDLFDYGFDVQYRKYDDSLLNTLCDAHGSDKGEVSPDSNPYVWPSHSYADFYSLIFGLRRHDVASVVECGIGTNNPDLQSSMGVDGKPGASLRVWRDYFPNAMIFGCDIDREILFEEARIKTFHCDQTSSDSIKLFLDHAELRDGSVDIIIDDGLHEFSAGICFFENMIAALRQDGIYIIEDVSFADVIRYKDYFSKHGDAFEARFVYLKSPLVEFGENNNLVCVTRKAMD